VWSLEMVLMFIPCVLAPVRKPRAAENRLTRYGTFSETVRDSNSHW
jgi:hypothetical protein